MTKQQGDVIVGLASFGQATYETGFEMSCFFKGKTYTYKR